MLDNDALSGLLEFVCTQKQNKKKLLENTNVTELLPKVEIAQNETILNGNTIEWKQITTNLSNFYNNYLEVEAKLNKNICNLFQEHPIQLEARDIHSGIWPVALFVKKCIYFIKFCLNFQIIIIEIG